MLAVIWFDATRYLIPNWLVGSLLIIYPLAVYDMGHGAVDWKMALVGMAVVFAVGYFVFAMKWMGGGDIKLLAVCALWVGWRNLPEFMAYVTLLGGALSIVVLVLRKALPYVPWIAGQTLPRILRDHEPVPYGLAIAAGFLLLAAGGKIPAMP
ncbi:MAG: prepilin peptidase [Pseudomonadota bacterium]|nr:prepilin peptidase [Pseudomonadota bacterium]